VDSCGMNVRTFHSIDYVLKQYILQCSNSQNMFELLFVLQKNVRTFIRWLSRRSDIRSLAAHRDPKPKLCLSVARAALP
jgi:hypothetical protein